MRRRPTSSSSGVSAKTKFVNLAPEFFTVIEPADACLGYIWAEVPQLVCVGPSDHMGLGRGGIMISGWKSREEHQCGAVVVLGRIVQ
jgi:hypothetical protein